MALSRTLPKQSANIKSFGCIDATAGNPIAMTVHSIGSFRLIFQDVVSQTRARTPAEHRCGARKLEPGADLPDAIDPSAVTSAPRPQAWQDVMEQK
jgi:hypothetical protein